ncbi:MAG TPA: aminotransferase class III-fold pyridoxal phosphate-dependent enzyme, partial [Acidobacteriota bacterium]|nr:aminotransferase class III-fold pyridoxal phosphate-dependent enzyme [Acidobacteriota bacterium]
CAAASAVLDIFENEQLVDQSAIKGTYLKDRLRQIRSPKIREVRGLGLMLGIELRERATPYLKAMQSAGVLALNAGPNVIRLLPPLVIETSELDTIADVIEAVLSV